MNRRNLIIAAPVALLGAAGLWYTTRSGDTGPTLAAIAQDTSEVDTSGIAEMSMGNPDAKVTVTEYASYTCPHCRTFHQTVFGELKKNYIDTGKINFIYREVYFDRFGLWAAMVARCGGEMRYFGISSILYDTQEEWVAGGDPALVAQNLRKIGKTAGLSDAELDACMNDGEKAKALVATYQKNAEADDVNSTPTFLINGEKYGNMGYDEFSTLLDAKLAE